VDPLTSLTLNSPAVINAADFFSSVGLFVVFIGLLFDGKSSIIGWFLDLLLLAGS